MFSASLIDHTDTSSFVTKETSYKDLISNFLQIRILFFNVMMHNSLNNCMLYFVLCANSMYINMVTTHSALHQCGPSHSGLMSHSVLRKLEVKAVTVCCCLNCMVPMAALRDETGEHISQLMSGNLPAGTFQQLK